MAGPKITFPLNPQTDADEIALNVTPAKTLSNRAGLSPDRPAKGVFAKYPVSTPKWTGRAGAAENDYRNTMARMFIELEATELKKFLASIEASAPDAHGGESRALAAVLAGPRSPDKGTGYIDFLLQDVQMPFQEKAQVVETLADNYVIYYFGQAAVPFTFSGVVLNTFEDDQAVNMLRMYRDMLRGTHLARRRKLLRLRFNGMIVAGSVMGLSLNLAADSEMYLSFNMQVMPKTVTLLPNKSFGLVVLKDAAADPAFDEPVEAARVPTAARLTTPTAQNVGIVNGAAGSVEPGTENETSQETDEVVAAREAAQEEAAIQAQSDQAIATILVEATTQSDKLLADARAQAGAAF